MVVINIVNYDGKFYLFMEILNFTFVLKHDNIIKNSRDVGHYFERSYVVPDSCKVS